MTNPSVFFQCSEVFNFDYVNETVAANNEFNETLDDFENLMCQGAYAPDANLASVTIYNVSQTMQSLIRMQLIAIGLR